MDVMCRDDDDGAASGSEGSSQLQAGTPAAGTASASRGVMSRSLSALRPMRTGATVAMRSARLWLLRRSEVKKRLKTSSQVQFEMRFLNHG